MYTFRVPFQSQTRYCSAWLISWSISSQIPKSWQSSIISQIYCSQTQANSEQDLHWNKLLYLWLIVPSPVNTYAFKITLVKDSPKFWKIFRGGIIRFLSPILNWCHSSLRTLHFKYGKWWRNKLIDLYRMTPTLAIHIVLPSWPFLHLSSTIH